MYYERVLSDGFAELLMADGQLRWLFDYVKSHDDLDFLLGKNNEKEWISVYRGLTRIFMISQPNDRNMKTVEFSVGAAQAYKDICPGFFGKKMISDISLSPIEEIRKYLEGKGYSDRYYGNKKEGYYQNSLSRKFGICGSNDSDFVILDKEVVVGYKNQDEKDRLFLPMRDEYKKLLGIISDIDPGRYVKNLAANSIGNELDFLAVNKQGDILLIELKHGTNTAGIYLSPLQIGLYYEIFKDFQSNKNLTCTLESAVNKMFMQKQKIGLINPNWKLPALSGKIIPVLIVCEPYAKSSARKKFHEILKICKEKRNVDFLKGLLTFAYTEDRGLTPWV